MLTFIGGRVLSALPVLFLTTVLAFSMVHLIPGDAAVVAAGENASPEQIDAMRQRLGLDQPLITQYVNWVGALLRGDLGTSLFSSRRNVDLIGAALPVTLSLTLLSLAWSLVLGVLMGTLAGLRRGSWIDRILTSTTTLGISLPSFWLGAILVTLFALNAPVFPASGYSPLSEGAGTWFQHLVLPALALGTVTAAEIARQARSGIIDVKDQDYIRTATAKGLSSSKVVFKHMSKNAAIPVVTVFGLQAAHLIGGSVVIEQVFGLPGLGTFAVHSVIARDLPAIQAFIVLITVIVLIVNLLVDMSYGYFNPKVRRS